MEFRDVKSNYEMIIKDNIKHGDTALGEKEIGNKLSDFDILQILGAGEFGSVVKVKSKKNLRIYAMKKYDLSTIEKDYLKYYENESLFMAKLDHPNICKIYNTFKEGNIIYMIMEYMDNGNLYTFIEANKKLNKRISEEKLWNIFIQCIKGLVYIHSLGLIHRDIKPTNLLLNNKGEVKIIDFNVSSLLNIQKANHFTKDFQKQEEIINQMTQVGSGEFMAPEMKNVENNNIFYDCKTDVFSMGKTFCCLAFYTIVLPDDPYNDIYSKELIDVIIAMTKEVQKRPTSSQMYDIIMKTYSEKYIHISGLMSCINCFSLYNSFKNYFLEKGDDIGPLNIISRQLNLIIKNLDTKNPQQKSLNNLLIEFRELLYKNGIKKNKDKNNEIEPIFIISFL